MKAALNTTYGTIVIRLETEKAPETAANFAQYVRDGFYNGTIFHRVIGNFMIQGGGFTDAMEQKTTRANIQNESANGLSNVTGTVAMARTPDPHSASAQFFINVADNLFLDKARSQDGWGYCVFGEVVEGMDVVNKIKAVATGRNGFHQDVPTEPVLIESATLIEE
ncbi:peptidylprolyl isomerase [Isoalcanivorax beigongshangi]|uniref:Peptidyl-prolyl cis-trans isomerase n=1 Tax=Isoalcanivorax beigongshangi TaxID=3238810 RepID=A0ABV4AGU6_9GAMM